MPDREDLSPARVFLAVWPDDAVRNRLVEEGRRLQKALSGHLSRPDTLHLTLVFIGNLVPARLPEMCTALRSVSSHRFQVDFDRTDCWRHNRIAYLAPSHPPDALYNLVSALERVLDQLAIPFDRRAYNPHITLLRKTECPKGNPADGRVSAPPEWGDFAPIKWPASDFVLVQSTPQSDGAHYQILERFLLS